jgi:hypothetical protein
MTQGVYEGPIRDEQQAGIFHQNYQILIEHKVNSSISPDKKKKNTGEKRHSVLKNSLRSSRKDLEEQYFGREH